MDKRIILIIALGLSMQGCKKQLGSFIDGETKPRHVVRTDSNYSKQLKSYTKKISQMNVNAAGVKEVNAMIKSIKNRVVSAPNIWEKQNLKNFEAEAKKFKEGVNKLKYVGFSKDKYCISGVCIGDGITKLKRKKWLKLSLKHNGNHWVKLDKNGEVIKHSLYNKDRHKGSAKTLKVLAPYIAFQQFDNRALSYLNKLTTVCEQTSLVGSFKTRNGYSVEVTLTNVANENDRQEFKVTNIYEIFWGISNYNNKPKVKAIEAKLRDQFPDVVSRKDFRKNRRLNVWDHWVHFDAGSGAASVRIADPKGRHRNLKANNKHLMQQRQCKVAISFD